MKKTAIAIIILTLTLGSSYMYADWWPLRPHYEYHNIDVEQALDCYWGVVCGYDKATNKGLAGQFDYCASDFDRWTNIPSSLEDGYVYNDIISGCCWDPYCQYAYIVGYKRSGADKYKGLIFRCNYYWSPGNPPSDFVDLTQNLPDPYKESSYISSTPILSVAVDHPASGVGPYTTVAISGGNGMILFSTDHGDTWFEPATRPYADDQSEWYKCTFYNYNGLFQPVFVVIGDNAGIIAWTTDLGNTWTTQSFDQEYTITDYGTYQGKLLPLGLPNATYSDKVVGLSYGYFAVKDEDTYTLYDASPDDSNSIWWWWSAASYGEWPQPSSYLFAGSDGGIIIYEEGGYKAEWIKYPCVEPPPHDTTYWLTGMGDMRTMVSRWQ